MKRKVWSKSSWKGYEALQQPEYEDKKRYRSVLKSLQGYPPLVFAGEIDTLKSQIAEASEGKRFILQGGDCAERFSDCSEKAIINKIKIMLQMSIILAHGARKPIVRIGRIAGQYAKPRSKPTEIIDNVEMFSFRGDSVNAFEPDPEKRKPDPDRLLTSFFHAAATSNYIRSVIAGGFADLHHPYTWNLYSMEKTKEWPKYKKIIDRILDSINFMEAFGGTDSEKLGRIEYYTSHEGLLLGYEEAMTRKDKASGNYYNMGAHMLWIGERTRDIKGAHVEYYRGISNPIGIKVGPTADAEEIIRILDILNPLNEKGKIILITRLGVQKVKRILPRLIKAVFASEHKVTWSCDPMHGNIISKKCNLKTNDFSLILNELKQTFAIHKRCRSYLAGVHFELTGEDVTECLGGAIELTDADLPKNYHTACDPRLNYAQSMEMAFLISNYLQSL